MNRSAPTIVEERRGGTIWFRLAWFLLAAFIVAGSAGTWAPYEPGIWAPTLVSVPDVVLNVLLYVPFGALGFLSMRGDYHRHWFRLVLRVTLLAVLFSGINEAFQLYTIDRVASLTDIASAMIGAAASATAIGLWRGPK